MSFKNFDGAIQLVVSGTQVLTSTASATYKVGLDEYTSTVDSMAADLVIIGHDICCGPGAGEERSIRCRRGERR